MEEIKSLIKALGKCPEAAEDKLEAYAVVIAMGPTYLWFQLHELRTLAESFGLTAEEASTSLAEMAEGAAKTLFGSGMPAEMESSMFAQRIPSRSANAVRATSAACKCLVVRCFSRFV